MGREVTVRVAVPPLRVAEPRLVDPLKKLTVPPGMPSDEETEALRVTDWPLLAGFGDADRVVEVATGPGLVPPPEFEEPPHPARRVEARSSRQAGRVRRIGGSFKTL
jgi:hypothetical protein